MSRDILQDGGLVSALEGARTATGQVAAARAEQEALTEALAASAESCRPPALTAARLALAVRRLASRRPLLALPANALRDAFLESLDRDQVISAFQIFLLWYVTVCFKQTKGFRTRPVSHRQVELALTK